jgi:hypothetical protein
MMRRIIAMSLLVLFAAYAAVAASPRAPDSDDAAWANISVLIIELTSLSLPPRVERAFLLTLNAAADAAREGQAARAQTLLRTFTFEVRGVKRARRIPAETANPLIEKVEKLLATMGETAPQ